MKITKSQSAKIKKHLPKTAVNTIWKRIKKVVGERQIQLVLSGDKEDLHGIIPIAIELSNAEKKKIEKVQESLSQL